jgi:hypothetical protein
MTAKLQHLQNYIKNDKSQYLIINDVFGNGSTIFTMLKIYYTNSNRCLLKEELNLSSIEVIYKSNTDYTPSKIVTKIKVSNLYINISNLIKSLSLVVYNSFNNAHHSTYRVGGLFYWDNIR